MADTKNPETVTIMDERYRELKRAWDDSKLLRTTSVEEFRLWCQVNKGTRTVEEGLRACTPAELYTLLYQCAPSTWVYSSNWMWEIKRRLEAREQEAKEACLELDRQVPIMPGEVRE